MGLIYAAVNLSNPRNSRLAPLTVKALVDTGVVNLCVPEHVAVQLELAELDVARLRPPAASTRSCPMWARCK